MNIPRWLLGVLIVVWLCAQVMEIALWYRIAFGHC